MFIEGKELVEFSNGMQPNSIFGTAA